MKKLGFCKGEDEMKRLFIALFVAFCSFGIIIPMQTSITKAFTETEDIKQTTVTNVKAASVGTTSIRLTWTGTDGVDGYLIYRQDSKGKYGYRGMVRGAATSTYTDTTAETGEYNFYWIFPYKDINGKMETGIPAPYVYAKAVPASATNIKAVSVGTTSVKLTWNAVSNIDGYIIYRQIGNGKFEYRTIAKGTSFVDTTAKCGEYNYYRVYPYKVVNGKNVVGTSVEYKYSKPVPSPVSNLKVSRNNYKGLTLSWNGVSNVDGYIIYRQDEGGTKFYYVGMTKNTSYNDNNILDRDIHFYRVYAYKKVDGKNVVSTSTSYVYGRAHNEPDIFGGVGSYTAYDCTYIPMYVENNGTKPLTFYSEGAMLEDNDFYDYDRDLFISTSENGGRVNSITIQPGQSRYIYCRVIGDPTIYDRYSTIILEFTYDGLRYYSTSSNYYGYNYFQIS